MADDAKVEVAANEAPVATSLAAALGSKEGEEVFAVAHIFASFNDTFGACRRAPPAPAALPPLQPPPLTAPRLSPSPHRSAHH